MNIRLYFAYGADMVKRQMSNRCPGAELQGIAVLKGHRFLINSKGVATIDKCPASKVNGMLWSISAENERSLDWYVGVSSGVCVKSQVEVTLISEGGTHISALVYVATDCTQGHSRPGYLYAIIDAADRYGLPKDYIEELKRCNEKGG